MLESVGGLFSGAYFLEQRSFFGTRRGGGEGGGDGEESLADSNQTEESDWTPPTIPPGLKWKEIGEEKPKTCVQIVNEGLSNALTKRVNAAAAAYAKSKNAALSG